LQLSFFFFLPPTRSSVNTGGHSFTPFSPFFPSSVEACVTITILSPLLEVNFPPLSPVKIGNGCSTPSFFFPPFTLKSQTRQKMADSFALPFLLPCSRSRHSFPSPRECRTLAEGTTPNSPFSLQEAAHRKCVRRPRWSSPFFSSFSLSSIKPDNFGGW